MKEITIYKKGTIITHWTNVKRVILEASGNLQVWLSYGESEIVKTYWTKKDYDWFEVE